MGSSGRVLTQNRNGLMMHSSLEAVERRTRQAGLAAVLGVLLVVLGGLWRGTRRPVGQVTGRQPKMMRTPAFYAVASAGYFGLCYRLWRPLPLTLARPARTLALTLGAMLYFPGLGLVLWGRLTLAQMYNVSSSLGTQLYADHQLITHGPFALVRHPMYLGVLFTAIGGLLLYRTWTFAFVLLQFPALLVRARREEQALAEAFGAQWLDYARRVPAWLPAVRRAIRPASA
jgi:protein-S-isoprenylcysteine O-methyltransferase Ste14